MSQSDQGLGRWVGGDLKKSSLAPLFFLTANKRLPSFTQTAYCRRRSAGLPGPPWKKCGPFKGMFLTSPVTRSELLRPSTQRFANEADLFLFKMKWLQHNYSCYILLFDQLLLFFMPASLSISVKPWKSLCFTLPLEILRVFTSVYNVKKSSWWSWLTVNGGLNCKAKTALQSCSHHSLSLYRTKLILQ